MKFLATASLKLVAFADDPPPDYAILSYTYSQPSDELTAQDVSRLSSADPAGNNCQGRHAAGLRRVIKACAYARARNIKYLWVDSLCIDQSSSAELAESVIASFRLVWDAALCIAYLSDLPAETGNDATLADQESALSGCRWFTRSWTLQELVAARRVEFFDRDWKPRGVKAPTPPRPWLEMLSRVSGVDLAVLANRETIFSLSLGRRLSWAAHRRTTRPEDGAYALIGILGVGGHLTPRYGEGRRFAFLRLQKKIIKNTSDLSIFAWKRQQGDGSGVQGSGRQHPHPFSGVLADSPADFQHFSSRSDWTAPFVSDCELIHSSRGLCLRGPLYIHRHQPGVAREVVLLLRAPWGCEAISQQIGILLREVKPGLFVRADPQKLALPSLQHEEIVLGRIYICRDMDDSKVRHLCMEQQESPISVKRNSPTESAVAPAPAITTGVANPNTTSSPDAGILNTDRPHRLKRIASLATPMGDRASISHVKRRPKRGADQMSEPEHPPSYSSSEDDVLLFDSLPEKPERLEEEHHFQIVLPHLVKVGLRAWNDEKTVAATHPTKRPGFRPPIRASPYVTLGPISIPLRPFKRARKETDGPDACLLAGDSSESYTAETDRDDPDLCFVRSKYEALPDMLACPFYKLNPARHHSCMWELKLSDIRTIKQHVIVDHRLREHCPVCYAVFNSAADRDRHIIARSCSRCDAPVGLLEGVSEDKVDKLARRSDGIDWVPKANAKKRAKTRGTGSRRTARLTQEEMWFHMWDILFPDVPRPNSAYLSAPFEREAAALRQFWLQAGPELVSEVLKERNLLQWEEPQEEAALAALHWSVLKGMIEESGLLLPAEVKVDEGDPSTTGPKDVGSGRRRNDSSESL